jgi:hypothetical protein
MAACPQLCTNNAGFPALSRIDCNDPYGNEAGFDRVIFANCEAMQTLRNPSVFLEDGQTIDPAVVEPLIAACKLRITGVVNGSKQASTDVTARVSPCQPEVVIGRTHVFQFEDRINARYDNSLEKLYNYAAELSKNGGLYFAVVMCTGQVYGFYKGTFNVDMTFEADSQQKKLFTGTLSAQSSLQLLVPDYVYGLIELLDNYQAWECGQGYKDDSPYDLAYLLDN